MYVRQIFSVQERGSLCRPATCTRSCLPYRPHHVPVLPFSKLNITFFGYFNPESIFKIMNKNYFRGELNDISAKKEAPPCTFQCDPGFLFCHQHLFLVVGQPIHMPGAELCPTSIQKVGVNPRALFGAVIVECTVKVFLPAKIGVADRPSAAR